MKATRAFLAVCVCLIFAGMAGAADHFAAPNGTRSGDGTIEHPWDLDTALGSPNGSQPSSVRPGDTIWLRGGVYIPATDNGFMSHVTGTSGAPIIVRNYNGERATLQASTHAYVLAIYGSDTWYWGLEGTTAGVSRTANQPGSFNNPLAFGFAVYGPRIKIINSIVHDTAQGFSAYNSSPDSEFYGNISYYNGWMASDRNHGHGMYLQNITGTKLVQDNFVGDNADEGIQAYGSGGATITGVTIQGNTLYNTSSWPFPHFQYNLVLGGGQTNSGNTVTENMSYFTPSEDYGFVNIGQYTPASNLRATNNVFVGGYISVAVEGVAGPFVFTGNKIYNRPSSLRIAELGQYSGQNLGGYTWDNNSYFGLNRFFYGTYDGNNTSGSYLDLNGWRSQTGLDGQSTFAASPSGTWTYVRKNKYEAKRANITIYNWDLLSSVDVDLSAVLSAGDQFVIKDAQNFYGPAVASGTFGGGTVSIPMNGLSKAPGVGFSAPAHTGPMLGTFIVMPPGAATPILQPSPTPDPAPAPNPTPAPAPAPSSGVDLTGYTVCASEGGNCSFTGTKSVAYGAGQKFVTLTITGGTPCTNSVFGDPNFGVAKACYTQDTTTPAAAPVPQPVAAPASTPTPAPTPAPTPVPIVTSTSTRFAIGNTVQVLSNLGSNLNVRANPNAGLAPIGSEQPGSMGTVVAGPALDGGLTFWRVQFGDGVAGWVVEWYITRASGSVAPVTPVPQPTPAPTPAPAPVPVSAPVVAPVQTAPSGSTKFTVGSAVQVLPNLGSKLNVRANPNAGLTPIGAEQPGSVGTVVGGPMQAGGFTFWRVQFADGLTGWVVEWYIR